MATYFCPNLSNPQVKQDFDSLVSKLGENRAYFYWNKHEGNISAISSELATPSKIENLDRYLSISNYSNIEEGYYKAEGYVPLNKKSLNGKLYYRVDSSNPNSNGTLISSENISSFLSGLQDEYDVASYGGTHAFFEYQPFFLQKHYISFC